jgi:hypothetical protein
MPESQALKHLHELAVGKTCYFWYWFVNAAGNANYGLVSNLTVQFTLTTESAVGAQYFSSAPPPRSSHALTVESTPPTGVSITSSTADGGTTKYQKTLSAGSPVDLQAPAIDPTGYTFSQWMLGTSAQPPGQKEIQFTLNQSQTAVAQYSAIPYTLTVESTPPTNVSIRSSTGQNGATPYAYPGILYGKTVNLAAPASDPAGYQFKLWTVNGAAQTAGRKSISFAMGGDTTAVAQYAQLFGELQVVLLPPAAVSNEAKWQVDGGEWQDSGTRVSNLTVADHVVSFNTICGWITPSNQTVSIKANSVAKVTGTYVFMGQGTYNGIFYLPGCTDEEQEGMLNDLTVTASGTYSGKLLTGVSTNAVTGVFTNCGETSNFVQRAAAQGSPLILEMAFDWSGSTPTLSGTVSGTNAGACMANLTIKSAAKKSASAEYTAWLLPTNPVPGYGYILMTNNAGAVTLSVNLADGASFVQTVPLSGANDLPVYGNLYGGKGALLGWISLQSGSPAGNLTWIKQASRSSANFPNGFTNTVAVQGSPWTNLAPHIAAINLPSGQLEITGGGLLSNLTFNVSVNNNNALVKLANFPTNSLTGSINPKNGQLIVTFANGAGKTTTGTGAALQNVAEAGGFFLVKTNPGSIFLDP